MPELKLSGDFSVDRFHVFCHGVGIASTDGDEDLLLRRVDVVRHGSSGGLSMSEHRRLLLADQGSGQNGVPMLGQVGLLRCTP